MDWTPQHPTGSINKLSRLIETIKYLKPIQYYGRLKLYYYKPKVKAKTTPLICQKKRVFIPPPLKTAQLLSANKVVILNHIQDISSAVIWNDRRHEKLWLYHLHYFDFLHSHFPTTQTHWHDQ